MESDQERRASDEEGMGRHPLELIGEGLLLAAVVISPWAYGSVEDTFRFALCGVLLVASLLCLWPDLSRGQLPRGVRVALAFPVLGLAQVIFKSSVAPVLTLEATLTASAMAMVWAAIDARAGSTSTHTSRRLAFALLLVCASESVFAAVQWSTDRQSLFGRKGEFQTMPFGSYVNHNNFAGLVSLGIPIAIAMAVGDLRRSGKLTARGLGLLGLACGLTITVLASGSRGGTLALVVGLLTLVWVTGGLRKRRSQDKRPRSWLVPFVIGAGILVLAALVVPESTRSRLADISTKGGSVAYRIDIALASWHAFSNRPLLGAGLGAFADAATPFKTGHGDVRSERAEADLIEFGVEGGLIFLLGLGLFWRFAWRAAHGEMIHGRDRSGRWLRAGALASCVTMLFHSFFDFGFRIPANALAFSVVLGIATAGSAAPRASVIWRCRAVAAVLLALAVACAYRGIGAAQERAALARASPESRLDALQALVDNHPYLENARRQRGLAWVALAYSRGGYDPSRLRRARADFETVVRTRPQWGEVRADLGWVKYYEGKVDEANDEMRRATQLDPTHMGVGLAFAQLLAWSGDLPGAVGELSRLRRMNPAWPRASALDLAASWSAERRLLAVIP